MFLPLPFISMQQFCAEQLGLYSYQNYLEVLLLSCIIYKSLRWLQQDHTKHLVLQIYAYASVMILSYASSCVTLFWIMFCSLPAVILLSIVLHQKQLQKNFVLGSSKTLTPQTMPSKNWLELFIRSSLLAAYQNKQIFCIIERTDQMNLLLTTPCLLHLPVQQEIVDLLLSSSALQNPSIIWLHQSGIINSVNATWKESFVHELLPTNFATEHDGLCVLLTQKTDAIIFSIDPKTRLAMLWHQGISMQQITIDQLMTSCKHILYKNISHETVQKSGVSYAAQNNTATSSSKLH